MKKLLTALALASLAISANAQHYGHGHRHGHHYHGGGYNWIAPVILGGVVTYALTRPATPVVVQPQQPVIVQQQPSVVYIDGIAYSKQWMQINGQWQEVLVKL